MQVQTRAITFEDDTPSVTIQNPYLDAARAAGVNVLEPDLPWWKLEHPPGWADSYSKRFELIKQYCYAIPNMEALKAIRAVGPVIEVGAGSGYWAWCLRQIGADVIATDSGDWPWDTMHTEVERESATVSAERFPDRALMFCWPYMDKMAIEALTAYRGECVIYIGEGSGGCTATDEFFTALDEGWTEVRDVAIPSWYGINDRLTIYRRKTDGDALDRGTGGDASGRDDSGGDRGSRVEPAVGERAGANTGR